MIRTLRTRLVAAAMLSLLVVLTVILGVILLGSYRGIVSDADRILDLLAEGEGTFPTLPADFNWEEEGPRRRHQPGAEGPDHEISSREYPTFRRALICTLLWRAASFFRR